MKAELKNYRQSPRKTRLVADVVRGKSVPEAILVLSHMPKRAASPLLKLLKSAVANAKSSLGIEKDLLFVKKITVDKGMVLKRFMPRARGSASPIRKRMSHVEIILDTKQK